MELQLVKAVAIAIGMEYLRASTERPRLHSAYEGAAVLREGYDILWKSVKKADVEQMRASAIRLSATALRFVVDACPPTKANSGAGTSARKPLDEWHEREVAASERWQTGTPNLGGRSNPGPRRDEHGPQDGQPARSNMVSGTRPKRPRCPGR